jgi:hypothetical protein
MRRLNTGLDLDALSMRDPLTRQIVLISRGDVAQRQPARVFVEEAQSVARGGSVAARPATLG